MTNIYAQAYKLETEKGVQSFLKDFNRIAEARYYANDLSISDMLLDFEFAVEKALTGRQKEVIKLTYFEDLKQVDVANKLNLTQQTIQEHISNAVKNLATFHMLDKQREVE